MSLDASTRRTLRFSMFLQSFAVLMFGVVTVLQITSKGLTALTVVFGAATAVCFAVLVMTRRYVKANADDGPAAP